VKESGSRLKSKSEKRFCCGGGVKLERRVVFWKVLWDNGTRTMCWGTL
jgi:hypothetical protein